jgi:murein DD-endopeptidase / murein LD-carboxypeptidase
MQARKGPHDEKGNPGSGTSAVHIDLLVSAQSFGDRVDFSVFLFGHYRAGGVRPGAMVSRALRVFREASRAGNRPELPDYSSPILDLPSGGSEAIEPTPTKPPDKLGALDRSDRNRVLSRLDKAIQSFLGAPYVLGGHTRRGTDCSGFVQAVFFEAGVDLPRGSENQFKVGREVTRPELRKGDLVFFCTQRNRISHVGIVTDPARGLFAHASSPRGVVISYLNSRYYRYRYAGARRVIRL